ncbi:cytochrome P450 [Streptomyces sp. ME02-8801-2C]|uniref:cytochrome P450 n=1 Tax=Streptomyces sp. ME02-8801-2C TaxID=3028680 RepID=UPI0029A894BE|nr:cytochrome P450 [Streptomyces sp. ME02-8801-2C]MDX3453284.1 cytochrome P450 [Streptomyces sp. ME02-8801-2C]
MSETTTFPPLPMHRTALLHPPSEYALLREQSRISRIALWGGNTPWLVTRHEDARAVLSDARFSAENHRDGFPGLQPTPPPRTPGQLFAMDAPDHTRLRRMLIPDFTFRRAEELRPFIQQLTDRLIDDLVAKGPTVDLVENFTLPLPLLVICELLGVPYADREFIHRHAAAFATVTDGPEAMRAGWGALFGYLMELLAAKTAEPGDDLLSRLATEQVATGEATAAEAAGLAVMLLIAGHETTASMLSLGVVTLLSHPVQLAALHADSELVPGAVEELLRYLTIVHIGIRRIATEDVEIGGVTVRAGEGVVVSLQAANRDPRAFADPDTFDITRDTQHHLTFSHGLHNCLGQSLARAELQIALPTLFNRLPGLRLTAPAEVDAHEGRAVHGVRALPVTW